MQNRCQKMKMTKKSKKRHFSTTHIKNAIFYNALDTLCQIFNNIYCFLLHQAVAMVGELVGRCAHSRAIFKRVKEKQNLYILYIYITYNIYNICNWPVCHTVFVIRSWGPFFSFFKKKNLSPSENALVLTFGWQSANRVKKSTILTSPLRVKLPHGDFEMWQLACSGFQAQM